MEQGLTWALLLWRSPPGMVLLYSALITHLGLGLWALTGAAPCGCRPGRPRSSCSALAIPALLLSHVAGTRADRRPARHHAVVRAGAPVPLGVRPDWPACGRSASFSSSGSTAAWGCTSGPVSPVVSARGAGILRGRSPRAVVVRGCGRSWRACCRIEAVRAGNSRDSTTCACGGAFPRRPESTVRADDPFWSIASEHRAGGATALLF